MQCQWIGDQNPAFERVHFCGKKTLPGKSYCAEHYSRMYTVAPAHKRLLQQAAVERKREFEAKTFGT